MSPVVVIPSSPAAATKRRQTVLGTIGAGRTRRATLPQRHHKFSFLYALLNPKSRQWQAILFKQVISSVILVDLVSFIFSTEPSLKQYHSTFHVIEGISSTIFLMEYLARMVTCTEKQKFHQWGPVMGRLRFMMSADAIIDALSIAPFFLEPLVGLDLPRLTYLRFVRLLRITRTEGYMRAIDSVYRVIYYNKEIMYVSLFLCILLVLVTGMLLYYTRPTVDANDDQWSSILATMYLATLLLTGQGGPEGDMPWYTKLVVLLTSFVSVAMFAIPASMLTWGFEAEAARCAKRAWQKSQRAKEGIFIDSSDDDYSTDEEYQRMIAGEESETDDVDAQHRALIEKFNELDTDHSGTITIKEFLAFSRAQGSNDGRVDLVALTNRVKRLEAAMESNSNKLDKILQTLEAKKYR